MASAVACQSVLVRLMSASVVVADRAGKIIREIMEKGDLGIIDKGINDLQTEADRSSQRCIINSLSRQFPKVTIIGEEVLEKQENEEDFVVNLNDCDIINTICPENLLSVKEEDVVIWVDPLDGTAEYTQGLLDHVTVLIGVVVDGRPVGGVIHQPYYNYKCQEDYSKLGRTMWGIVGAGTFGIKHQLPPENTRIITISRSRSNPIINSTVAALKPDQVIKVGGAGHKVLLVIEGKAHAYVSPISGCKKWDICAPEALLTAFGGKLTDIHGHNIKYHSQVERKNPTGILATFAASAHDWYIANIPKEAKDYAYTVETPGINTT